MQKKKEAKICDFILSAILFGLIGIVLLCGILFYRMNYQTREILVSRGTNDMRIIISQVGETKKKPETDIKGRITLYDGTRKVTECDLKLPNKNTELYAYDFEILWNSDSVNVFVYSLGKNFEISLEDGKVIWYYIYDEQDADMSQTLEYDAGIMENETTSEKTDKFEEDQEEYEKTRDMAKIFAYLLESDFYSEETIDTYLLEQHTLDDIDYYYYEEEFSKSYSLKGDLCITIFFAEMQRKDLSFYYHIHHYLQFSKKMEDGNREYVLMEKKQGVSEDLFMDETVTILGRYYVDKKGNVIEE